MPNRKYNTVETIKKYKEMLGVSNVINTRFEHSLCGKDLLKGGENIAVFTQQR